MINNMDNSMENRLNQPISEIIKLRHSVRTYEHKPLSREVREALESYLDEINHLEGIFGGKIRVKLIKKDHGDKDIKLGTYGVIKGAQSYLAVACEKGKYDLEDLGFLFEKIILFCTALGLGTVWISGTFNKGNFSKAMQLKESELLPIVSPVGIESDQKSFIAKLFGDNSNKRKEFGQVFFDGNFNTPLTKENAKEYADVLEMIRLAPSAMNKQPWRILKEDHALHIYSDSKLEMSRVDIGICMCHLALAAEENGFKGEFKVLGPKENVPYKYFVSWIF